MKRPLVVIVGIAAGLVLVAAAGASAHTALRFVSQGTSSGSVLSDDASATRTETPEPSESPEDQATAEPTEKPEPTEKAEPTEKPEPTEPPDNDNEQGGNDNQGEHDSGDHGGDSGD